MSDIETTFLPFATSNFTNLKYHINLNVDDWVWVVFENADPYFPIIVGLCNAKDIYPDGAKGTTSPDWYSNITNDSNINETAVSYNGSYNKVNSFDFGDIHIDIDEENLQIVLYSDNWYMVLSQDKNLHLNFDNIFIKTDTGLGLNINSNIIKIDNNGVYVEDKNTNKVTMDTNGIKLEDKNGNKIEMKIAEVNINNGNMKILI